MAQPHLPADPLERLIADGRLHTRPSHYYGTPTVLTIDLDLLATTMVGHLSEVYLYDNRIRNQYIGNTAQAIQALTVDITSMVDFAIGQCYNYLRTILERKAPAVRTNRMNTRCPVPHDQEFPTWISSTLSSIGPCRLVDGARDTLVVYATTAATMNYYGRVNPPVYSEGHYHRLISALKAIHVPCAPFARNTEEGSYFPTITPVIDGYVWTCYGQVHPSHYENEDIARIAFVTSPIGVTPFENIGMTIGYVNDEATVTALTAVAAPEGLPAGATAASTGRRAGAVFNVNLHGLQLAVAPQGDNPGQLAGFYVVGRGMSAYYSCVLAHNITATEVREVLRHRLMPA